MKKKIAIVLDVEKYDWNGGINYYNNLINLIDPKKYQVFIITGFSTKINKNLFDNKFKFIKSELCDPYSFKWILRKIIFRIFKQDVLFKKYLLNNKFDYLTHSISLGNQNNIKVINWIPDLQPLILKENFKLKDIRKYYKQFNEFLEYSDKLIFSSVTEKKKFEKNFKIKNKKKILVFNNIPKLLKKNKIISYEKLRKKFGIKKKFFFIPNQFWKHKNHICLFKSINLLKKLNVQFVFTGTLSDYRDKDYVDFLKNYLNKNDLKKQIKILGNVSYQEVVSLIINCKAIINPSNYEGWSTSVEESKIYNKDLILSNIDTHLEQVNNKAFFFKKNNHIDLKRKILNSLNKKDIKFNYFTAKKGYKKKVKILKNEVKKIYS